MPRIAAASIAEHVAQQEAAVADAAVRLFVERGYHAVTLADVAAEVGLARSSLYRYVPDKAHLLLGWFRRELPEQAARAGEVLAGPGEPEARVAAWALEQVAYARRPEHALIAALGEAASQFDEETRAELASSHRALLAPLADTLAEAGLAEAEIAAATELLGALVLAAARHEAAGGDPEATKQRLLAAVGGVLCAPSHETLRGI